MVEPVSFVSSVLTLVGAAIKCSSEVLDYIHDVKTAPDYIKSIASSLRSCRIFLYGMQRLPDQLVGTNTIYGLGTEFFLQEPLRNFEDTCNQLSRKIPPYSWRSRYGQISFSRRLTWIFNKNQIEDLLCRLQRQQDALGHLLIQLIHATVSDSHTTLEEVHTMVQEMHRGCDHVVQTLNKVKAESTVSDVEEHAVKAELDKLDRTIREVRSQTALSEARSRSSSVAGSSPRASWIDVPEQPNIDAVLNSRGDTQHPRSRAPTISHVEDMSMPPGTQFRETSRPRFSNTYASRDLARRGMSHTAISRERWETPTLVDAGNPQSTTRTSSGNEAFHHSARSPRSLQTAPRSSESLPRRRRQEGEPEERQISAPVNVDDPQRVTHRFVRNDDGHYFSQPLRQAPELSEIRSAPPGLLDATRHMSEVEQRAYVQGTLDTMDRQIAHSFSARSLRDRQRDPFDLQREHDIEWRRFQSGFRPLETPQQPSHRTFVVHREDASRTDLDSGETPVVRSSSEHDGFNQDRAADTTASHSQPLQQRTTNLRARSDWERSVTTNVQGSEPRQRARHARRRSGANNENAGSSESLTAEGRKEALRSSTRAAIPIEEFVPPQRPRTSTRRR